jgi:tRNA dimethylallyltransferase
VAGGTGLYIKSLTHGLGKLPAPDPDVRGKAEKLLEEKGIGALQELARNLSPELYESLADKNNPRRLVRLIETAQIADRDACGTWKAMGKGPKITGLTMPRPELNERIGLRVRKMYAAGLLDEAERLLSKGISAGGGPACGGEISLTAAKAIGYAEAFAVFRKKLTVEEAVELTCRRTRQLAKRQMTWFRNQADVDWVMIEPGMTIEHTARMVMDCWERTGPTPIVP